MRLRFGTALVPVVLLGAACRFGVELDGVFSDSVDQDASSERNENPVADSSWVEAGQDAMDALADVESDGEGVRYCATISPTPTFCDDFDGVDAGSSISAQSRAEPREDTFVSPPRALRVIVDPIDGGATSASLSIPLLIAPRRLRLRFDLKVEAASGGTNVVSFAFTAGTRIAHLDLQLLATGVRVTEYIVASDGGTTSVVHDLTSLRWPSPWMHMELVWTDSFRASFIVNGFPVETDVPLSSNWFKGLANVSYGAAYANTSSPSAREFWLDNVVLDVE